MKKNDQDRIEKALKGESIYGDDFSEAELEQWFRDEENAYYNLSTKDSNYSYGYHALNMRHGYRHLPDRNFKKILGIGSAFGDELTPVAHRGSEITILEPSDNFRTEELNGVRIKYVKPDHSGSLPFKDNYFDLITCFGVLHHIPNVTAVIGEFSRCLQYDGYLLLREPIISMGDWRQPRRGLTKRERGIPLAALKLVLASHGIHVLKESRCVFPLITRLRYFMKKPVYNSALAVLLDHALCALPLWPEAYHASNFFDRLRPSSVFLVLSKQKP